MVSNSYGESARACTTDEVVEFESDRPAGRDARGSAFLFSSGDDGDEVGQRAPSSPTTRASDPYVTAVGGTATAIDAAGKLASSRPAGARTSTRCPRTASSGSREGFLYGAGGGFSQLFNRPSYQNGVVPSSLPAGRAVPDVAMDADPTTGMLVGETQEFPDGNHYGEYRIGGTSLASPLFAGFQALAAQTAGRLRAS